MRLKHLDLIIAMVIASLNVIYALLPSHSPIIGIILALPLVFVLPGYMLLEFLFHGRPLDASHRFLLSLGLSLVIDIAGGFLLNILPIGLRTVSWGVFLGLMTMIASLFVMYLRRGAQSPGRKLILFRINIYECLLLGLAITVAVLSILYSTIGAMKQPYPGFTQLWMLPTVQAGKSCIVHLGVRSFETTSVKYRVTVTVQESQTANWSSVNLEPQQQWNQLVQIPPEAVANVHVAAQIYRFDKPNTVYRNVASTLYGCPTLHATPSP